MRRAGVVFLSAAALWAAAITSTQSGNWNSETTWAGGVPPGAGDTAIIANGHTVTIPAGTTVTVGTSPADDTATAAIACASTTGTGVLVINGTLYYRGTVSQCLSVWMIGAGAAIYHDSSLAAVPANAHYTWRIGQASGQYAARLDVLGTAGNRVTWTNAPGSGRAGQIGCTGNYQDCGHVRMGYATLTSLGMSSDYFLRSYPYSANATVAFDHVLLEDCGTLSLDNLGAAASFTVLNSSFKAPANTKSSLGRSLEIASGSNVIVKTTGTRRIENVYLEGQFRINGASTGLRQGGFTTKNVVFAGTTASGQAPLSASPSAGWADGDWDRVLIWDRIVGSTGPSNGPGGVIRRTVALRTGATLNPHFLMGAHSATWDGFVAELTGDVPDRNNGDFLQTSIASYATTSVYRNGLMVPSPGGQTAGTWINHTGSGSCDQTTSFHSATTVENTTFLGELTQGTGIGVGVETNTGCTGAFVAVRDNIVWRTDTGAAYAVNSSTASGIAAGTFQNVDYNWFHPNVTSGYYDNQGDSPSPYDPAPPGAHDTRNADPLWTEQARGTLKWAQRLKPGITSLDEVLAEFAKMNDDTGYDVRFTILDLYHWLRAGYRPRNPATRTAGHAGGQVGAVGLDEAYSEIDSPATIRRWMAGAIANN